MKSIIPFDSKNPIKDLSEILKQHINEDLIIVCIGTDKFIGDSLGPIIGSLLTHYNFPYPVYGTLHTPIHALNLNKSLSNIKKLHPSSYIIAIDACLGTSSQVGDICVRDIPISPGKGVGKKLKDVGDLSIIGIVAKNDYESFLSSNSIRLSFIYDLASIISKSLISAINSNYMP
ncbi:MAG: spore protease YyaC [Clostridium sp.]|uniref:spore protease YyaC n=1 Tax=Clostridium sp. TaxID=1506 RepID=UPI003EE58AFE